jgi:hypothetical protein
MAVEVERLVGSPHARDELAARGLEHASRFRWDEAIDAHADVLASVAR